eukprot:15476160-Alexandrium_andersonii.AAC.1
MPRTSVYAPRPARGDSQNPSSPSTRPMGASPPGNTLPKARPAGEFRKILAGARSPTADHQNASSQPGGRSKQFQ